MAIPLNHTTREHRVATRSSSIGGTPVAAYTASPQRGRVTKIGCVVQGVITTADCAVAVAINGTTNANLAFTIPVAGAAAGQVVSAVPASLVYVSEDDAITFTPSGASGATIAGDFFAVIVAA